MTPNYAICQGEVRMEIPTCQSQMNAISSPPSEIFNTSNVGEPAGLKSEADLFIPGWHLTKPATAAKVRERPGVPCSSLIQMVMNMTLLPKTRTRTEHICKVSAYITFYIRKGAKERVLLIVWISIYGECQCLQYLQLNFVCFAETCWP